MNESKIYAKSLKEKSCMYKVNDIIDSIINYMETNGLKRGEFLPSWTSSYIDTRSTTMAKSKTFHKDVIEDALEKTSKKYCQEDKGVPNRWL